MASRCYNAGVNGIGNQSIDFLNDTIKVMLVNSAYAHNPDSEFVSDIVANEVAGATRQTLGSKTVTKDNTNDRSVFDGADVTFPSVTAGSTVGGAVVFKDAGGADSGNTLLAFVELADTATNGGNIGVAFHANGIFYGQI